MVDIQKKSLEKFFSFIERVPKTGKLVLIHDNDTDGVCSATIAYRILKHILPKLTIVPYTQQKGEVAIQEETIAFVAEERPDVAVIQDLAVDQNPYTLKRLELHVKKILILDHHQRMNDLDSEKTVLIKADELSSEIPMSYYCTTKMAYDLYSTLTDVSSMNLEWIAAVGIKADCAEAGWSGFLRTIGYATIKTHAEAVEHAIGAIWAVKQREGIAEARKVLFRAKTPDKFLTKRMIAYRGKVDREVEAQVECFKATAEQAGDGYIYEFSSPYSIKSHVINEISWKHHPDKTIVLLQTDKETKKVFISARRQDGKVKTNLLLQKAVENIPHASAGGHIPASGGNIPLEYKGRFLTRIRGLL